MTDTPEASSLTDRELLEFAAKAAGLTGYVYEWVNGPYFIVPADPAVHRSEPTTYDWLNDDGDALRLAVKLGLFVDAGAHTASDGGHTKFGQVGERDPYAATRRAIVRAAAAIGRSAA